MKTVDELDSELTALRSLTLAQLALLRQHAGLGEDSGGPLDGMMGIYSKASSQGKPIAVVGTRSLADGVPAGKPDSPANLSSIYNHHSSRSGGKA